MTSNQNEHERYIAGLDFLWLELTQQCNLQCVHCYSDSGPQATGAHRLQLQDWKSVLDQAAALSCHNLQFIGGEPCLHPALPELLQYARDRGFENIEVFTNGTLMSDRLVSVFCKFKVDLAFSVYASTPEVHDEITQSTGSFARTITAIRRARESGLKVRVGIIVMDAARQGIDQTVAMLRDMGVESIGTDRVRGVGRGMTISPTARSGVHELCGNCWRGKLCITSDGSAYPCVFSRFEKVGDVVTDGLAPIISGVALKTFRKTLAVQDQRHPTGKCRPDVCGPEECNPGECYPDNAPCKPVFDQKIGVRKWP